MQPDYPNDSDGDALRRVAAHGSDMSLPMLIDFPVVVATELAAQQFSAVAAGNGFNVQVWKHDDDSKWDVICDVEMVPSYDGVVRVQRQLTELPVPFHGVCDCWATFGNKPLGSPGAV